MFNLDTLKLALGEESGGAHFKYLKNKNEGGRNNAKGNTFENFFAVFIIARFFNQNADSQDTLFSSQVIAFVDDFVVKQVKQNTEYCFQIKDVVELYWQGGKHELRDDFKNHFEISSKLGVTSNLGLVVSRKNVFDHLVANLPSEFSSFVKVIHFEPASSMNNLIRTNSMVREELTKMCALSNPSIDKLETLGTILLGSWDATDKMDVSLGMLIDGSCNLNPHYIKGRSNAVSRKLNDIFKSIAGFSYKVENGFIAWKYYDSDSGTIQYVIGSNEFEQWENDVFNSEIKSFEDLESFLSA